jgi:hypothetical protein
MLWTGEAHLGNIERERYRAWDHRQRRVVNIANDYFRPATGPPVLIDGVNVKYISSGMVKRLHEDYNARRLQAERASLISVLTARIQTEERRLYEALEAEALEDQRREAEGWFYDPHGGPDGAGAWVNPYLDEDEDLEGLDA